eukprot:TRINITY_DN1833_c0_g1_i1.p1 TRINITY_DN1833_c0_g1~~TRINITY_DN1833_c0_g1_i1.p1  ORF type:complete len:197 (-),score=11.93 TRINITY_DN1833_c0_g1_i1:50-613(-)
MTQRLRQWIVSDASFPTLKELFKKIPVDVGFNVEIKYPGPDLDVYLNVAERNFYVDAILKVVYDHAKYNRFIFFSSFDPDVCSLLARKQNRFPVFFLTECKNRRRDIRTTSIEHAIEFCTTYRLRGIVSEAKQIMCDFRIVQKIKAANMILFTYGSANNDLESVKLQKANGVDGIISDKVTKLVTVL